MRYRSMSLVFLAGLALASPASAASQIKHVIVVMMENTDAGSVEDNARMKYVNQRLAKEAARADHFTDPLPVDANSEPHYLVMEAGTNVIDGKPVMDNERPSATRLFRGHDHLTYQLDHAASPATWMTYQQGIATGSNMICPLANTSLDYAFRHNPFVFFADIAGDPPDPHNVYCIAHTRPLTSLMADMAAGALANYVFITPNVCDDMHDVCGGDRFIRGDTFLAKAVQPLIDWSLNNDAVVFIAWDEGSAIAGTGHERLAFYAAGSGVKPGYVGHIAYTHRSIVRTIERVFGLPPLAAVKDDPDLSDLFEAGALP